VTEQNVVSVMALEIIPGREGEFLSLAGRMQGLIRRKGYGNNQLLRDGTDPLRYYDIRIWRNAEAAAQAERDRDIAELREAFGAHVLSRPIVDIAWAVEFGLAAAGPWQERRSGGDRRLTERRAKMLSFEGPERRQEDRRVTQRRTAVLEGGDASSDEIALVAAARMARENARANFSNFRVGAALRTADGAIVTGCNVESPTYGLTMCAERVAVFKAISEGHAPPVSIAIVADSSIPTAPCGACRQVLWEVAGDIEIVLADLGGIRSRYSLKSLLPHPFDERVIR
jgi:cytidine deaminase